MDAGFPKRSTSDVLKERGASPRPQSRLEHETGCREVLSLPRDHPKGPSPSAWGPTDAPPTTTSILLKSMKFASLLAKFSTGDPTALPAREVFRKATEEAALIFRLGDWRIEVGNSPDLILVDLSRPEMTPGFDIYSDVVYSSNGYIVDTVISLGKVVMENRYVPGEDEILKNAGRMGESSRRALIPPPALPVCFG